jgi:hypothetical protein
MPKTAKINNAKSLSPVAPNSACLTEEDMIQYLFYPLTKEERFRIESHITDCDICYDALAGAKKFRSEKDLREYTDALRLAVKEKYVHYDPGMRKNKLIYYSAAALVLISFSSIGYWVLRDSNARVADEFIRPYSNMIPLSRGESRLTLLEEAMAAYESENYAEAKEKLDRFLKDIPEHEAANLYFGISAILSGEAEKAILHLQKASGSKDTRIAEASQWYLALSYLKLNKTAEAKGLLQSIRQSGGYFALSADSVVNRIGRE